MSILGLILIVTSIIIVVVAVSITRQVPKDYDYENDDGFLDLLKKFSDIFFLFAILLAIIGIVCMVLDKILN